MKRYLVNGVMGLSLLLVFAADADAQRAPRRRGGGNQPSGNQNQGGGNEQQVTNNNATPTYNPNLNIPITYDTVAAGGKTMPSMRNDNAFDKSNINDRTPLAYEHLRWDDALFAEKVWRELDLREKINSPFRYEAVENNESQLFVDILLKVVRSGEVTAFGDDRFSSPLSMEELNMQTAGGYDTADKVDINDPSKVIGRVVTSRSFDSKNVVKLRLKEEWVFDRESSRLFVRILGVAPVLTKYDEASGRERGQSVMFWVYYPDLRPTLAKYEVYNSKNMGMGRMTWEELFEARMFSSYITKSTIDNPSNKNIRQIIKDPILALLEGDNIKEKIFNYEQDLWSY
jgi:gliding motility associated protien GldN